MIVTFYIKDIDSLIGFQLGFGKILKSYSHLGVSSDLLRFAFI